MLRAIWFFIQIALIVALALWIAERPGDIELHWSDYTVTMRAGVFLLALAGVALAGFLILNLARLILSIPRRIAGLERENRRQRGYRALTRGFVAIAAGDGKKASQLARQTRRLIPKDRGLPVLLEAQAARLQGEEGAARRSFQELLKDRDASFFGIRGLLQSALDAGDHEEALSRAREALQSYPKQGWILRTVYDLEIRTRRWDDAMKTLRRAVSAGAVEKSAAKRDETAMLLHRAEEDTTAGLRRDALAKLERAHKLDPLFVPAAALLAERYIEQGKRMRAASIIERAWKNAPHPDLLPLWERLAPQNKPSDPMRRLRWYEKLLALKPDSAEGQVAAARAAMDDGLWGEAKSYLMAAERLRPSAKIYRLRAKIEQHTSRNEEAMREWLEKAADAPPEKVWTCRETGIIYPRWSAIAQPHGSFNTIVWDFPSSPHRRAANEIGAPETDALLLHPAA